MNEHENITLEALLYQALEQGDTLDEAARTVRDETPNLSAVSLAQAIVVVCSPSAQMSRGGAVSGAALLNSTTDPVADAILIAGALKAAGYPLDQIAAAVVAPGVYPDLTAFQLGTVLMSPSVFPDTTAAQMRSALAAANFSQPNIDSAIALLFPQPATGPIQDGAVLNFKCLGNAPNPQFMWLDGRTGNGSVGLAPETSGPYTGTRWRAHAQGNNAYAFECLGALVNPQHVWLDGRTGNGSVGLAPGTASPYTGTKWEVINHSNDTYRLKCLGAFVNPQFVWLDGRTADGSVVLAPLTTVGGVSSSEQQTASSAAPDANAPRRVTYQAHVTQLGWMDEVSDGAVAGTTGRKLPMEAVKIRLADRRVTYQAHVAGTGWTGEVSDGAVAGTTGRKLQMEAIRIRADRGHVYYQAHVAGTGWTSEVSDGAVAGMTGRGVAIEALRIRFEDASDTGTLWQASTPQRQIGPQGVTAAPFDDTAAVNLYLPLTKIRVHFGEVLDSIQAFYGSQQTALPIHGGEGGNMTDVILDAGDYLTQVSGNYGGWLGGNFILQLTFQTKNGKSYGPFGTMNNAFPITPFSLEANQNEKVVAFFGSASLPPGQVGGYLCSLGLTLQPV